MMLLKKIIKKFISIIKSAKIKFGSLYIYLIDLNNINISKKKYLVVKASKIEELKSICDEREYYFKKVYQEWLRAGYTCFIVKIEGKAAGIIWLVNSDTVPLDFNYKLKLKYGVEAALIDGYILKEFRGNGIFRDIWQTAVYEAKKRNIKKLYATILPDNIKSIKTHYTLGMKHVYQILFCYRFFWVNVYYRKQIVPPIEITDLRKDINFKYLIGQKIVSLKLTQKRKSLSNLL